MNKYRNVKCVCLYGHKHDSKFEASYCHRLFDRQQNCEFYDYKTQYTYDLVVNGKLICKHKVDFLVRYGGINPRLEVHEVKGPETREWINKKKLFQALYPEINYIVIKQLGGNGWTSKRKKISYKIPKKIIKNFIQPHP